MVLIYAYTASPRLQYICSFIFKDLLHSDHSITQDLSEFERFDGIKINYSGQFIAHCPFTLDPSSLLFEQGIRKQPIECFEVNSYKAFFKIANTGFPFDIFAASFYLLSRYEEYLPDTKDRYGRYAHENALAFKEGFLQVPLINTWVKDFALKLNEAYPAFTYYISDFTFTPTYDIDIAWSYKHKGFYRTVGGAFQSLRQFKWGAFLRRKQVLIGLKKDPFDAFTQLDILHEKYQLSPLYFF